MRALGVALLVWSCACSQLIASPNSDSFGSGQNSFAIEFVAIGHVGNLPDPTGNPVNSGAVGYNYRIGKFEIAEHMVKSANALGGLGIVVGNRGANKPAMGLSWLEAAIFVNWLNTSSGFEPAYKLIAPQPPFLSPTFHLWAPGEVGYDPANPYRNSLAKYVIPSNDEWYKAAFYDPRREGYFDYPTGRNSTPAPVASGTEPNTAVFNQNSGPADVDQAGGLSPYGTMGQGGNAWEWQETAYDGSNNTAGEIRQFRGGSYQPAASELQKFARDGYTIWGGGSTWGLRVAAVEPALVTLPGDFNSDGVVDAADYTVWRDGLGSIYYPHGFDTWRTYFGQTVASFGAASNPVPEPIGLAAAWIAASIAPVPRRRNPSSK